MVAVAIASGLAGVVACSSFDEEAPTDGGAGVEATTPDGTTTTDSGGDAGADASDGGCGAPSRVGLFDPGTGRFMLFPENAPSVPQEIIIQAAVGAMPLAGHWKKGSLDTIGYRLVATGINTFFLLDNRASASVDTIGFGNAQAGSFTFVGDWRGEGVDDVGLYAPSGAGWFFHAASSDGGDEGVIYGVANVSTIRPFGGHFGPAPGGDSMGMFDQAAGRFQIKYSRTGGPADLTIETTHAGPKTWPVVGDWDGCGVTRVGVYDDATGIFYLLRENKTKATEDVIPLGGAYANRNYLPIAGRWKP